MIGTYITKEDFAKRRAQLAHGDHGSLMENYEKKLRHGDIVGAYGIGLIINHKFGEGDRTAEDYKELDGIGAYKE